MTSEGWRELGLGARGNLSDVPVLGGVKADMGSLGRAFGPLRRAPTLGDLGVGGNAAVLIVDDVVIVCCGGEVGDGGGAAMWGQRAEGGGGD